MNAALRSLALAGGLALASLHAAPAAPPPAPFKLTSPAFADNAPLAKKFAGDRQGQSKLRRPKHFATAEMGQPASRNQQLRLDDDRPRGPRRTGRCAYGDLWHPGLGDRLRRGRTQQALGQVRRWQEHDGAADLFRPLHAAWRLASLYASS